ncbi:MAG TPA: type VI secretion system protein TssA [Terriglobia bacterium]|nr:type VI secretion system protein TssA [Terriglobia bacterium]
MIEVDKLIQPISSQSPSGESLRYSMVYDSIKAARREDDANAPQGIWQTKLKKADWQTVKTICLETLESRSKDLQVGAWLLEACIHLDGFNGLADGLHVLTVLCETFWDTLYPPLDPDDPDYRFGPIAWIDEKLTLTLKLVPITSPHTGDAPSYTWADWEAAMHQSKHPVKEKTPSKKAVGDNRTLQTKFMSSSSLTLNEFYIDLKQQLQHALLELERLSRLLVDFDQNQEGALHHMRDLLLSIEHFVDDLLAGRNVDEFEPPTESKHEMPSPRKPEPEMAANEPRDYQFINGPVRSRAQAYQMLAEAADYLMKTEPHSPTPYLVRRAVAWGGMTLGELLQQILRNPGELGEMYRLLGLDEIPQQKGKKE